MTVESRRAAEVPTGAPPRGRRRLLPPPLWRFAPRRLWHDTVTLTLMLAVLTMLSVAAAAGPLYADAVSDAAVRLTLESVPAGAAAKTAPVVRLNGGIDPESSQWTALLRSLSELPGLGPARVTTQTISTELHPKLLFDPVGPVLTGGGGSAPVRLFGVDDPASRLVVVTQAADVDEGVWLPEPVARTTGVAAGDTVQVQLSGLPEAVPTSTRVRGTYAVERDGRTPKTPPGERLWADLGAEAFPGDALRPTARAHLAIADLATTAAVAKRSGDQLLWSAQARLSDTSPRLGQFHRTADAVSLLRRLLIARSELADDPVALRPSVVSGMEDLAEHADVLSAAAQRGAAVTTRVGLVLSLALVVAAAAYSMGRRRREVQLGAGTGRRPLSAGLLYAAELVPAGVLAGVVGWVAARAVVAETVGSSTPTRSVLRTAGLWSAGAVCAALMASVVVAAAANRVETRRLEGRPEVRLPWVLVLVVVAVSATVGLLTRPPAAGDTLGTLDLLVPPLVVAAVAAVGSRLAFGLLRRTRTATRPPSRRTLVAWLARRRLQAPDRGREAAATIAATGLAMLAFSLASFSSLHLTVEDRAAVAVGAVQVDRMEASWQLDPGVAQQAAEPKDGSPLEFSDVPAARNPNLPRGQSAVWRASTTVATSEDGVNLLVVDPTRFAAAAAWGSPDGPVAAGRALLPTLAADDAAATAKLRRDGLSSSVPVLLVGTVGDLDLEVGSAVTVDTLNDPVRLEVRGLLDAFPGAGTGQPTFVVPADSFFASQLNNDPRLRPGSRAARNRPVEFQTYLWSDSGTGAAETLAAHGITPDLVGTLAQERATPVYVAAAQARRYQVALGLVFGAVGLAAVALAAVRSARRSPAADRMLAWTGAGRHAPGRARALEIAVVLALSCALSALALLALRPLAHLLLEPGDGRTPDAVLALPGSVLLAAAGWLALAGLAAVAGMVLAASSQSTVEVLRGED
ncbi:MAG: hypothetical protein ACJ72B_17960 [Ornithinibacter sp.]